MTIPVSRSEHDRSTDPPMVGPAPSPPRVHVCVIGSGWHFMSGISVYTCRLTNALADRHDVSAVLMRRLLPRRLYPGAARVGADLSVLSYREEVTVVDGVDYFWFPSIARAFRGLLRSRPQVLLFQWWTGTVLHTYLALAVLGRLLGCAIVVEFHETQDPGEAAHVGARLYVALLLHRFLRMASSFVVHSEYDRQAVTATYRLDPSEVFVVPHGPYDHLHPADGGGGVGLAPEPGVCTVLFFGTIRPYKGLEHLLAAFNGLSHDQARRFRLLIVGETWEGWTLPSRLVDASPHRELITFINRYVTDREVGEIFSSVDAVVLPYTRSSSSGPLHIAMSRGLPVAVTPVGGLSEAATPYEGTRFIRAGDPADIRAALLEFADMEKRRFADPHSWSRSVDLLDAVLVAPPARGKPRRPCASGQASGSSNRLRHDRRPPPGWVRRYLTQSQIEQSVPRR